MGATSGSVASTTESSIPSTRAARRKVSSDPSPFVSILVTAGIDMLQRRASTAAAVVFLAPLRHLKRIFGGFGRGLVPGTVCELGAQVREGGHGAVHAKLAPALGGNHATITVFAVFGKRAG